MPQYNVLDEVFVKFEPVGSLAEMDLTQAKERLNKTEASLQLDWRKVGDIEAEMAEYKPSEELVDLTYGFVGRDISKEDDPAFSVLSIEGDLLKINIFDTRMGKGLQKVMDEGFPMRFTANVDIGEDPNKAIAFTNFFVVGVEKPKVEEPKALESSLIALPGKDFDLDNPMGV